MHKSYWLFASVGLACSAPESPEATSLSATLEHRLRDDRTGACVSVALLSDQIERSTVCAKKTRKLDANSAFEIGSISKTMTGFLLERLVEQGKLSLSDPLSKYVPVAVPSFEGQPIRLEHLVSHTSGLPVLPSQIAPAHVQNPYADLTEDQLFGSLADVQLAQAPGAHWAYSNYGFMLLSYVVSTVGGADVEALLHAQLFTPLGMRAFIAQRPSGVHDVKGHTGLGIEAEPWTFPPKLAGVGAVHATLDDMISYAQAALGSGDPATVAAIVKTGDQLLATDGPAMGIGWVRTDVGPHALVLHDGGTGGFSSLIAIDRVQRRAVIALSDTSFETVGGLTELALHVLEPDAVPLDLPRKKAVAPTDLLEELAGHYTLAGDSIELRVVKGALVGSVDGAELPLGYDSYGDFYPTKDLDALLTPVRRDGAPTTFDWNQGGVVTRAERLP
jgi:CubicO group peptidase (beta-lactamase class C family)